jgi:hypothetical protein
MNFSFTMEFRLSRSLSHEIFSFSRWNSGYQGAFHTNFSFSRWNSSYQGALFMNFSFIIEPRLSRSLSHDFFLFHDGIHKMRDLGEDSFHIYITKSIYIGSASLKTLPLDLEPPLQGKEYGPSYSNATTKKKAIVFFPKSLIVTWFGFLIFRNVNLRK